ncbi:hypothetical protein WJX81_007766 [Elliptochloris bilobata]|uniref:LysM domain-containing protein n=1 Tax=Elliptochloris bilobata TaxID=381761 RepID=A0AAW1SAG8_9CHLO
MASLLRCLALPILAVVVLAAFPAASRELAPAPAPSALYTSLAVQRLARAEQSSGTTCFTAKGGEKCGGHLAHRYTMSLQAFLALNPIACPAKGIVISAGATVCVSNAYTELQTAPGVRANTFRSACK